MTEEQYKLINELKDKIHSLIKLYEQTREEKTYLFQEKQELVDLLEKKESEYAELNKRYETLKTTKILELSSDDKHETKIKINRMIREIDKCVALLNR